MNPIDNQIATQLLFIQPMTIIKNDTVEKTIGDASASSSNTTKHLNGMTTDAAHRGSTAERSVLTAEKSSMCIVNELARYNSLSVQYHLVSESGPPHEKVFTVILKIGGDDGEEYKAEGASIKKAQQAAAALALQKSEVLEAIEKSQKVKLARQERRVKTKGKIWSPQCTPTVELNMLAMKRGEQVEYKMKELPQHPRINMHIPINQPNHSINLNRFSTYQRADLSNNIFQHSNYTSACHQTNNQPNQLPLSFHYPQCPNVSFYEAHLIVGGQRSFIGNGRTAQAARHDAAAKALRELKKLPFIETKTHFKEIEENIPNSVKENVESSSNEQVNQEYYEDHEDTIAAAASSCFDNNSQVNEITANSCKSPISLVHELALKLKFGVEFDVIEQTGPSHLPLFVTRCRVGMITTIGQGNGKKISKKNAAEKMLFELNKKDQPVFKKKNDFHLKSKDSNEEQGEGKVNLTTSFDATQQNCSSRSTNPNRTASGRQKKKRSNNIIKDIPSNTRNTQNQLEQSQSEKCESNERDNKILESTITEENMNETAAASTSIACSISSELPSSPQFIHPINRLIQLQQAKHEREPQFTVISECVNWKQREFTIECKIIINSPTRGADVLTSIGNGPNKKIAKRNAAESMLGKLGYSKMKIGNAKERNVTKENIDFGVHGIFNGNGNKGIRKVKFVDDNNLILSSNSKINCDSQRNLDFGERKLAVPGLLVLPKTAENAISPATQS